VHGLRTKEVIILRKLLSEMDASFKEIKAIYIKTTYL
jgi:hypothetical protein